MKTEKIGQRGKTAEKLVEAVLKKWNGQSGFAYHRLADARAAMGRLGASPADFLYFSGGKAGFLEVKSTTHNFRLARAAVSQLPTIQKFSHAGAYNLILVYHSTLDVWRVLFPGGLSMEVPSWDLTDVPTFDSAEDALISTGYFVL